MTKEDILHHFQDINFRYNDCMMYDDLSCMLDELIAENKCFDGMTNGEVIQALFPNMTIAHKSSNGVLIVVESLDSPYPHEFYTEWWNSPYQKGGE